MFIALADVIMMALQLVRLQHQVLLPHNFLAWGQVALVHFVFCWYERFVVLVHLNLLLGHSLDLQIAPLDELRELAQPILHAVFQCVFDCVFFLLRSVLCFPLSLSPVPLLLHRLLTLQKLLQHIWRDTTHF